MGLLLSQSPLYGLGCLPELRQLSSHVYLAEVTERIAQLIYTRAAAVYSQFSAMTVPVCTHGVVDTPTLFDSCGTYNLGPFKANRVVPCFTKDSMVSQAASRDEKAPDDCRKLTYRADPQQCMLFFCVCLDHEVIVGWHLGMHEGRRDVMVPVYRYFQQPPGLIMYDFACG